MVRAMKARKGTETVPLCYDAKDNTIRTVIVITERYLSHQETGEREEGAVYWGSRFLTHHRL